MRKRQRDRVRKRQRDRVRKRQRQTEGQRGRDRERERKKGRKNIINYSFLRIGVRKERLLIDHCTFSCLIKNFSIR